MCGDREINWYRSHSKDLQQKYGKEVHHLGFFHIPFPEYMDLYNDYEYYGHYNEVVSCPLMNTGFFDAIKESGDIQAVFVGHDHLNDFGGWIDSVELVYGRRTGYSGYGHLSGFQRGGRVIKLTEEFGDDGEVKVTRKHYVVIENPDEPEKDEDQEKVLRKRSGTRQEECMVGAGSEELLDSLFLDITRSNICSGNVVWNK